VRGRIAALLELGSGFNPEFSGRENVFLNGAILGLTHDEVRDLMPSILAFADIGEFVDRPVKTYSSGMALRLAFAVATAAAPQVLIVDEALAVGDEAFQRKCFARIESIRDAGAVVLFVSHSPQQILELCDTALLLEHGSVLMHGEPRRVVGEYQRLLYAPRDGALPAASADDEDSAAFDAGLRSASMVEYGTRGARIANLRLCTPDGRDVNVLVRGEAYVVSYDVAFDIETARVRCGTMIKTTTGIELGGGKYPQTELTGRIAAGTRMHLRYTFRCRLFGGTYFLNAGLAGEVDGTETYLHRLVDALAFRVLPDADFAPSGYVDFDFEVTCEQT
jgi:lipopolysaccharide transport system ATP-binding protein